ncbi:hypothetical protein ACLIA0_08130 [Bacillaceae bacterium W0354]
MNTKTIAEVYRLGLLIKFFSVEEVIHWIDNIIEERDVNDISSVLYDLSLVKDKKELVDLLGEIDGTVEKNTPTNILLGLIYNSWETKDEDETISMMNDLAYISYDYIDNLLFGTIVALVDQYEEAKNGYGNPSCSEETILGYVSEAKDSIKEFLVDYKQYIKLWEDKG